MNPLKYDMSSENMYYRMMGNTGIQVSILSYGFWATYGVKNRLQDSEGVEMAKECMKIARNAGVNCFDHAEAYGNPNGCLLYTSPSPRDPE